MQGLSVAVIHPRLRPHYTLDAFNAQQMEMYQRLAAARREHTNNIECPQCGQELWDTEPIVATQVNPAAIDPDNPPKQTIACKACGYQGVRFA